MREIKVKGTDLVQVQSVLSLELADDVVRIGLLAHLRPWGCRVKHHHRVVVEIRLLGALNVKPVKQTPCLPQVAAKHTAHCCWSRCTFPKSAWRSMQKKYTRQALDEISLILWYESERLD
jgi:hypothetical protein